MDWIDEEKRRRDMGIKQAISQDAHAAVNARYPRCTQEECFLCGDLTGRAGRGEDSIYDDADFGPYCRECYNRLFPEVETTIPEDG